MGENSKIEWTDHTFNPWIGCAKVSAGCAHCYAEAMMDTQYGKVQWGEGGTRLRTSAANWKKPEKWNRDAARDGVRRRVFCASLADVFEDREELEPWRVDLLELIGNTPWLDWLLLTKRPENAAAFLGGFYAHGVRVDEGYRFHTHPDSKIPWHNIWLGTSVENQEAANERIPHLLAAPAAVRFLSCEPLLEFVYLPNALSAALAQFPNVPGEAKPWIDWVIVGGESGAKARPCKIEWITSLKAQCRRFGVACFIKQLGGNRTWPQGMSFADAPTIKDKKGGDWSEWPEDLRVREFPVRS